MAIQADLDRLLRGWGVVGLTSVESLSSEVARDSVAVAPSPNCPELGGAETPSSHHSGSSLVTRLRAGARRLPGHRHRTSLLTVPQQFLSALLQATGPRRTSMGRCMRRRRALSRGERLGGI